MKPNGQLVTQAKRTDAEVRSLMEQGTRTAWRVADLCRTVRDERLWDELGFKNFDAWLDDAVGFSHSSVYQYMGLIEALPNVDIQELEKMPVVNAQALLHLPESQRTDPSWVRKAQQYTSKNFKVTVNEVPGALPIEYCYRKYKFFTPEQAASVDEVVEQMRDRLGVRTSPGTALAAACIELAMSWREK